MPAHSKLGKGNPGPFSNPRQSPLERQRVAKKKNQKDRERGRGRESERERNIEGGREREREREREKGERARDGERGEEDSPWTTLQRTLMVLLKRALKVSFREDGNLGTA